MKTTVDGISITLTDEQVKYIKEVKADRRKACNTFTRTLKYFGFKKIKGIKNSYENKKNYGMPKSITIRCCWAAKTCPELLIRRVWLHIGQYIQLLMN